MQLRVEHGERWSGPGRSSKTRPTAPIHIADRTWLLVVRDPNRPDVSLPLLLAVVGISLAALLGALILVWSRNERMEELQRQASQDSLTGLKNRRRFEEELRAAMARGRRERTTGALLMLDLDYFKQVNDSHGHPAGDHLIEEIADVLRRRTRESDVLARLGGDEFAVVLPRCTPAEARVAADAIAAAIREHAPGHEGARAGHRQRRRGDVRRRSADQLRVDRLRGRHGDVRGQGRRPRRVRSSTRSRSATSLDST